MTFTWVSSAFATYYESYIRPVTVTRNSSSEFAFVERIPSDAGSATVGSLEPGRSYEVMLLAGSNNETEKIGARIVVTTKSSTDNITEDPGLGLSGSIIAGVSIACVIAFIIIVVVVVVVIRRRRRSTAAVLDRFGGVESLVRTFTSLPRRGSVADAITTLL